MVKGVSRWMMAAALAGLGWSRMAPAHAFSGPDADPPSPVLVAGWLDDADDPDVSDDPDDDDQPRTARMSCREGTDALDEEQGRGHRGFDELARMGGPPTPRY
jgi:hypothetical protein